MKILRNIALKELLGKKLNPKENEYKKISKFLIRDITRELKKQNKYLTVNGSVAYGKSEKNICFVIEGTCINISENLWNRKLVVNKSVIYPYQKKILKSIAQKIFNKEILSISKLRKKNYTYYIIK